MYYSAWDNQCNNYFHTGRNSKTREACFADIRDWLIEGSGNDGEDEQKLYKLPEGELLEIFDVQIHSHTEKLQEEI